MWLRKSTQLSVVAKLRGRDGVFHRLSGSLAGIETCVPITEVLLAGIETCVPTTEALVASEAIRQWTDGLYVPYVCKVGESPPQRSR